MGEGAGVEVCMCVCVLGGRENKQEEEMGESEAASRGGVM